MEELGKWSSRAACPFTQVPSDTRGGGGPGARPLGKPSPRLRRWGEGPFQGPKKGRNPGVTAGQAERKVSAVQK